MTRFALRSGPLALAIAGCVTLLLSRSPLAWTTALDGQGVAGAALNAFEQDQQLSAPDGVPDDGFGESVALSGNTAVIGADTYPIDGTGTPRGAAYVFVRSGDLFIFQAKLVPNDASAGMQFGDSVAISGNVAVIGAPFHDVAGRVDAGAAYVFRRVGNLWQQETRLLGDATAVNFGQSVSIDGGTIVVGADDSSSGGSAFVFVQGLPAPGSSTFPWNQQQRLVAPTALLSDNFGETVAIRGETIIAGAPGARLSGVTRGAAFVFNRTGTTWTAESQPLSAPDGQASDFFGQGVAFDGARAVIAAPNAEVNGEDSGVAYVFLRQGAAWAFEQKLVPEVLGGDTSFGRKAIAIDGPLIAGAMAESITRAVFVFRFVAGAWTRERVDPSATSRSRTVALQGTTLLVGDDRVGVPGTAEVFTDQVLTNGLAFAPPVLSAPIVNGSTVTLNWSTVSTATRYQLRAGTFPLGSNAFNGDVGNTTSVVATNVANGSYFVRVHAVAGPTESAASNEVRVDVGPGTGCQIPSTPASLAFSRAGSLVTLNWSAAANATSYSVEAGSSSGASNIIVIDTGNANTQLMANAPPGTYFVRVRGKNACGVSGASNQVVITVP